MTMRCSERVQDSLPQQVFEAGVQFYVVLVQVAVELVGTEDFGDADQLQRREVRFGYKSETSL